MNRYFESGNTFSVNERNGEFLIREIIGVGASCVVYLADFIDEHGNRTEHLLKEYNPRHIDLYRDSSGELCIDTEEDTENFEYGMQHFVAGYERQNSIRRISEMKNATSNIQGIYHANGTRYIDMTCFHGQTYDKIQEKSVYDLLRRMKAVAQIVGNYHKAGFLHLDIKPENIFTIPETCEMVMLFDFDSVTEKSMITGNGVLSYSKSWAAPEQLPPVKVKNICEATDLFAVGEMIFAALFGRHSERDERRSFAEYAFDFDAEIFKNMNPRVFPLLGDLLRHTICGLPGKRYQTTGKLCDHLQEIIDILASDQPYLVSNVRPDISKAELGKSMVERIHKELQNRGRYFLKSTASRNMSKYSEKYINTYGCCYEVVVSLDCQYGLIDMVDGSNPEFFSKSILGNMRNFSPSPKSTKKIFEQIFDVLDGICDKRTLFLINNFHEGYIVDDSNFDVVLIQRLCKRLEMSNATILLNGVFDVKNFYTNRHYRYLHDLLIGLAQVNLKNDRPIRAEDCVKNAMKIALKCGSLTMKEAVIEDKALLSQIKIEQELSFGYGLDEDEVALDEYLAFSSACVDDI